MCGARNITTRGYRVTTRANNTVLQGYFHAEIAKNLKELGYGG